MLNGSRDGYSPQDSNIQSVVVNSYSNMDSIPDPTNVNLDTADPRDIICYLSGGEEEQQGRLDVRISAVFVIFIASTVTTVFPVLATRVKSFRVPLYVYLFARYFGSGVIIATAFIHLLDPAYDEIGPASCVGMTGNWASYTWPPAIAMASVMMIFLLDFLAEWYVEVKFGATDTATFDGLARANNALSDQPYSDEPSRELQLGQGQNLEEDCRCEPCAIQMKNSMLDDLESVSPSATQRAFREQIAAFLILEFGIIFHSVIIGLNLGVVGDEFFTLYPVMVFHQAFEGLGIGARLSAIPFPRHLRALPWLLCFAYGITTPVAIAIGLGVRSSYDSGSFTANVVSGIIDSASAGILLYTGLVEMLARDFLFNPSMTRNKKQNLFTLFCLFLGAGLMALLGKWA